MHRRRRPFVALFATLLVWLTSVGSTHTVVSRDVRLLGPTSDAVPSISVAVPRTTAIASREATRLPAFPHDVPSLLLPATADASIVAPAAARDAHATHSRVRLSQGLASTYDATAPPARS